MIKKLIRYIFEKQNLHIFKKKPFLKNIFKQNYSKRVLVCYITSPFYKGIHYSHTNGFECIEITKIFDELEYIVDVIEWSDFTTKIDYAVYDIILGFGNAFENSFFDDNCKALRVYYGTGAHPIFQNEQTIKRGKELFENTGKRFTNSLRLVNEPFNLSVTMCEYIFVLGNEFVADTYRQYFAGNIVVLNASTIKVFNMDFSNKNFEVSKKHFIWFGSNGAVHKGLDLLLNTFKTLPEYTLHICGEISKERVFESHYFQELYNTPNIITHGFVDIRSEKFKDLMNLCGFAIFPSASEGCSTGILNVVRNAGLVPIITKNTGIDVENREIIITELNEQAILKAIAASQEMSIGTLRYNSLFIYDLLEKRNSLENFRNELKEKIDRILPK